MLDVIAVGGAPGTGKTTLMKRLMPLCYVSPIPDTSVPLVPYHSNGTLIPQVYVLGRYDGEGYAQGTDRMSMAVQPKALEFIKELAAIDLYCTVLFEGDRLFTASFLEALNEFTRLTIVHLKANDELLQDRYQERGSNQDPVWLKGRHSKLSNILSNMVLMDAIESFTHETPDDSERICNFILDKVQHGN